MKVLDISCGTGLVGIALAAVGASVTFSEIGGAQLDLLKLNIKLNENEITKGKGEVVNIIELWWGTKECESFLKDVDNYDLVIASDLLYIAIRDGLEIELVSTLSSSIPSRWVFFSSLYIYIYIYKCIPITSNTTLE